MSIKLKQSPKRKHRLLYIPNYINESRNNKILDSNKISKTHLDSHTLLRTTTMNQSTIDNISNIHNTERSLTTSHDYNNNMKFKKKIKELISEEVTKSKETKTDNENDTNGNNNELISKIPKIKDNNNLINNLKKNKLTRSRYKRKTPRIFYEKAEIIRDTFRENQNLNIQNQPTNNIELNKILINSFGFNESLNFSKKMYTMSEKYYNILEIMKKRRTKLQIEHFDRVKYYLQCKKNGKKTKEILYSSTAHKEDKWAKKFFKTQYKDDKLSNYQYELFKINEKRKLKKKIHLNAEKFCDLILKMDSEPYEMKNTNENNFDSSKEQVSFKNLDRVIRLRGIQKTGKDFENNDFGLEVNEKGKEENNQVKNMLILTLEQLGPPKFIKSHFKSSTIRTYQTVSGNLFGA